MPDLYSNTIRIEIQKLLIFQIIESLECIKGNGPADLEKIVVVQAAILLCQAGIASNQVQGEEMVLKTFKNGSALEKFLQILGNQGMNLIFSGVFIYSELKKQSIRINAV